MSTLPWIQHLVIVPVLLPRIVGALLIPINQTRYGLKFALGIGSGLLLWMVSVALLLMAAALVVIVTLPAIKKTREVAFQEADLGA